MEIKSVSGVAGFRATGSPESLSEEDMLSYYGGSLPVGVFWTLIGIVISNWQDVREGYNDGISGKPPRYKS